MEKTETISFWQRIGLAFVAFFAVLFNRAFAVDVYQVRRVHKARVLPPADRPELPAAAKGEAAVAAAPRAGADRADALHLLAILQREGRLIDFLQEDLTGFSDSEVGAAARTVHEGCRKAVGSYFDLEPIYRDPEGANVVIEDGFDAAAVRLTGNVVGKPPFRGSLKHHGWRVKEVKLPSAPAGLDPAIVAPAEVELP